MNSEYNKIKIYLIAFILLFGSSCKKFVEIDPPRTDLIKTTVFSDDATATAAMLNIYYQMGFTGFSSGNVTSFSFLGSLCSDDQISYFISDPQATAEVQQINDNTIVANSGYLLRMWSDNYSIIYKANSIIEGVSQSTGLSSNLKKQLEGEAKFIRAFSFFYLVNLWGDVPLCITTDYRTNNTIPRSSKSQVYEQIVTDLKDAQSLLQDDYSVSNNERVRPNKGAATALLSRVYLYIGDWANAETQATSLISNTGLYNLSSTLSGVFTKNNSEAIWQLWSTARPKERSTFRFLADPFFGALRPDFANSFETGDLRGTTWVLNTITGYYSCIKYFSATTNPPAEYSTILRLAELYLIRGEARAQLNNIPGAQQDVNKIRNRAGLGNTIASDKNSLLLAIEQERRHELFTEWGHRWLDLKRTGRTTAILSPIKPNWSAYKELFPIPETQIINNPNTIQNPGY